MNKQNFTIPIYFFFLVLVLGMSCNKESKCGPGLSKGVIIGFDPCTALSTSIKGYVVKFENFDDTIVTYSKLPANIVIHDSLFSDFKNDYLFPVAYRDSFKIEASFRRVHELTITMCYPDIMVGEFQSVTKMKQYRIDCITKAN